MNDGARNPGPHPGQHGEVETLAAIAERCQRDPQRHCVYTGVDAATIVADVTDIEHWEHRLFVARVARIDEAGVAAGWLLADVDHELGRVWWWGPFVDDGHDWSVVSDALYRHARARLQTGGELPTGEEMAADARSDLFAALAARHGFTAEEGSASLVRHPPESAEHASTAASPGATVEPLRHEHHAAVSKLHEELFPGTHLTGHGLVMAEGDRLARLVAEACRRGFEHGATFAHLTVRTSNAGALGLYRSLGFDEERILAPYRRGISLA